MLKIRLQRVGRKHLPLFRVVLTDSKNSTKSGKFLEILGSHDPRNENNSVFKADRIKYWLKQGVQLSDTLHNLFITKKIIEGKKINKLPKKTPPKKEVVEEVKVEAPKVPETKTEEVPAPAPEPTPVVDDTPKTEEVAKEEAPTA